jgi:hypothetical protein
VSQTTDQRAKVNRYFGHLVVFQKGSKVLGGELTGTDSLCGICVRKIDRSNKGRMHPCSTILEHEFLDGDRGYCPVCQGWGKMGETLADSVKYSTQELRKLAQKIWTMMRWCDPEKWADIRLQRFFGNIYEPLMQLRGKDIGPREAAETVGRRSSREQVILYAKTLKKDVATGADPVNRILHFLES